jgi:hypothetical protein
MSAQEDVPWLTLRPDDLDRLERLASVVDKVSDDPFGLAFALRKTRAYEKTVAEFARPRDPHADRRAD